jgi:hypothetical protein
MIGLLWYSAADKSEAWMHELPQQLPCRPMEANVYHVTAKGRHGCLPGLPQVRAANGDILNSVAADQEKVILRHLPGPPRSCL